MTPRPPSSTPFPYTTLFRSRCHHDLVHERVHQFAKICYDPVTPRDFAVDKIADAGDEKDSQRDRAAVLPRRIEGRYKNDSRSEEHTSELQSRQCLVCRLLLE